MIDINSIVSLWPVFVSMLFLVVWLVRLEGKGSVNEDKIKELKTKLENVDSETLKILSDIRERLGRIEGQLSVSERHA